MPASAPPARWRAPCRGCRESAARCGRAAPLRATASSTLRHLPGMRDADRVADRHLEHTRAPAARRDRATTARRRHGAFERAAERRREVAAHARCRRPARVRRPSAYVASDSSMDWLMFARLNVSEAAAKTAISSTPAAERAVEPGQVRHERGVAHARPARDAREDLGRVGHLRHPLRADERRDFDHGSARGAQRGRRTRILSAVAMGAASFCSPSRGPTSTIGDASAGKVVTRSSSTSTHVRLHQLALAQRSAAHDAVARRAQRQLHLHRFEHEHRSPRRCTRRPAATSTFTTVRRHRRRQSDAGRCRASRPRWRSRRPRARATCPSAIAHGRPRRTGRRPRSRAVRRRRHAVPSGAVAATCEAAAVDDDGAVGPDVGGQFVAPCMTRSGDQRLTLASRAGCRTDRRSPCGRGPRQTRRPRDALPGGRGSHRRRQVRPRRASVVDLAVEEAGVDVAGDERPGARGCASRNGMFVRCRGSRSRASASRRARQRCSRASRPRR